MTNQHPITPPPELVAEWKRTAPNPINVREHYHYITVCAAQWGADQELEACCECLRQEGAWPWPEEVARLRAARRPKPPSLKEQALAALEHILHNSNTELGAETIRRALEALDD